MRRRRRRWLQQIWDLLLGTHRVTPGRIRTISLTNRRAIARAEQTQGWTDGPRWRLLQELDQ